MPTRRLWYVLACALAVSAVVHADDWPHWRGPNTSGVSAETGLPVEWSAKSGVAWTASIPGLGISSPIVWRDRVYVTSQIGSGVARPGPRRVRSRWDEAAQRQPPTP